MKLQYLGTAAAECWPAIFCECPACLEAARRGGRNIRHRSGAIVNDRVLIDLSADLYAMKLRLGLNLSRVRHVLITHAHSDHFYRETLENYLPGYAHIAHHGPLHLYGSAHTRAFFEEYAHSDACEPLGDHVVFHEVAPFERFRADTLCVTAYPAVHGCPGSLFYRIEEEGRSLLYAHDTGLWGEEVWAHLASEGRLSAVSLDCTFGPTHSDYTGHMGFSQNLQVKERMERSGLVQPGARFICHHFSHNGGMLHEEMCARMNPEGFDIAYDGMTVEI